MLTVRDVRKTYRRGKKPVLNGASLTAGSGECVGIVGANGSGKTTLLSILAGILPADGGCITYDDKEEAAPESYGASERSTDGGSGYRGADRKELARIMAYVPQENPLIEELTARDNLLLWYGKRLSGLERDPDELFGILGVSEFIGDRVAQLSGGMKKRLSICCAMSGNQPVLLMDEPGASLDLQAKERIGVYIDYKKKSGSTVILATHEEQEIRMCDRLYLLKEGRLMPLDFDGNIHTLVGKI